MGQLAKVRPPLSVLSQMSYVNVRNLHRRHLHHRCNLLSGRLVSCPPCQVAESTPR